MCISVFFLAQLTTGRKKFLKLFNFLTFLKLLVPKKKNNLTNNNLQNILFKKTVLSLLKQWQQQHNDSDGVSSCYFKSIKITSFPQSLHVCIIGELLIRSGVKHTRCLEILKRSCAALLKFDWPISKLTSLCTALFVSSKCFFNTAAGRHSVAVCRTVRVEAVNV